LPKRTAISYLESNDSGSFPCDYPLYTLQILGVDGKLAKDA